MHFSKQQTLNKFLKLCLTPPSFNKQTVHKYIYSILRFSRVDPSLKGDSSTHFGQRSLITYPIWRLISYFLFLTDLRTSRAERRNETAAARAGTQGKVHCSKPVEGNNERLVLILIGSATRLENHECARPVLFLAVEINTFLCPWLSLPSLFPFPSRFPSPKAWYLVCHLFLPLSFSPTRSFFLLQPDELPMGIMLLLTAAATRRSAIPSKWPIDKLG